MVAKQVLIIPDIHGRTFWKEPCRNWEGKIVFLGDYHDPYGIEIGEPSKEQSRKNLKELVEFIINRRNNPEIVESTICLLGNHDYSYFTGHLKCRYDYSHSGEIKELLNELDLQVSYDLEYKDSNIDNKFLFTHAGVTQRWMEVNNLSLEDIMHLTLENSKVLEQVPRSRGGDDFYGSCIWNSVEDYDREKHIPEYFQIFGHTWGGRLQPYIAKDYAMLDCRKAFILDLETKKIKSWS